MLSFLGENGRWALTAVHSSHHSGSKSLFPVRTEEVLTAEEPRSLPCSVISEELRELGQLALLQIGDDLTNSHFRKDMKKQSCGVLPQGHHWVLLLKGTAISHWGAEGLGSPRGHISGDP